MRTIVIAFLTVISGCASPPLKVIDIGRSGYFIRFRTCCDDFEAAAKAFCRKQGKQMVEGNFRLIPEEVTGPEQAATINFTCK